MILHRPAGMSTFQIGGAVAIIFSVVVGTLVLFLPSACTFVSSFLLLVLGAVTLIGGLTLLFGKILSGKQRR